MIKAANLFLNRRIHVKIMEWQKRYGVRLGGRQILNMFHADFATDQSMQGMNAITDL